jgi:hypothetical protein
MAGAASRKGGKRLKSKWFEPAWRKMRGQAGEDLMQCDLMRAGGPAFKNWTKRFMERAWEEERIPDQWRGDILITVFKKRQKGDPRNYRPVSLMAMMAKIMQRIWTQAAEEEVAELGWEEDRQFGSVKKRDRLMLLVLIDEICCHDEWNGGKGWIWVLTRDVVGAFTSLWKEGARWDL